MVCSRLPIRPAAAVDERSKTGGGAGSEWTEGIEGARHMVRGSIVGGNGSGRWGSKMGMAAIESLLLRLPLPLSAAAAASTAILVRPAAPWHTRNVNAGEAVCQVASSLRTVASWTIGSKRTRDTRPTHTPSTSSSNLGRTHSEALAIKRTAENAEEARPPHRTIRHTERG
jgi:hypothetical protein